MSIRLFLKAVDETLSSLLHEKVQKSAEERKKEEKERGKEKNKKTTQLVVFIWATLDKNRSLRTLSGPIVNNRGRCVFSLIADGVPRSSKMSTHEATVQPE